MRFNNLKTSFPSVFIFIVVLATVLAYPAATMSFASSSEGNPTNIDAGRFYADDSVSAQADSKNRISFGLTQKTIYIRRGKTIKLPFVAYMSEESTREISWSTSDRKIATVRKGHNRGKITVTGNKPEKLTIKAGKKTGCGKISLSSGKRAVTITVNVVSKAKPVNPKSIKIKGLPGLPKARYIYSGKTLKLNPAFTKGATAIATWKSSRPEVLSVDAAGKLKSLSKGWAKVTLMVGGKSKSVKIRVFGEGEFFDIDPIGDYK